MIEPRSGLHGFSNWLDFGKATLSLGTMLTLGMWAILTWALDGRYAPSALAQHVEANRTSAKSLEGQVGAIQTAIETVQASIIEGQIFDHQVSACNSESVEAKRFYAQRIIDLGNEYQALTGRRPSVTECASVRL